MNETLILVLAGLAGLVLGAIFFGGLWWTVNKGVSSQRPALWFLGSFLVRTSITLGGFYVVSGGHWERCSVETIRLEVVKSQEIRRIATCGNYVKSDGFNRAWERLMPCLLGFIVARLAVTWLTRPAGTNATHQTREVRHAPESR